MNNKSAINGNDTVPDYRADIRAIMRRDNTRFVPDGMTAANDLGLTTAVPTRIEVLVDARLKPVKFGNQEIHFKAAIVSPLYRVGGPAMRAVQALHWLRDVPSIPEKRSRIANALRRIIDEPSYGKAICADLCDGGPLCRSGCRRFRVT
jgi:hypothetical protein